jgi:hypothetical protein
LFQHSPKLWHPIKLVPAARSASLAYLFQYPFAATKQPLLFPMLPEQASSSQKPTGVDVMVTKCIAQRASGVIFASQAKK